MKHKVRTFIAVELSPAVSSRAGVLVERLRAAEADVRWVDPERMHLTIKFLGDVDARELHNVCRAVEDGAAGHTSFDLEIFGAGAFPNINRPRTIWLGGREGSEHVVALAESVEKAMQELGFRREARRFRPHLTIGRVRRGGAALGSLGKLLEENVDFEGGRSSVTELVTFSSRLTSAGPEYEVLGRAPLAELSR